MGADNISSLMTVETRPILRGLANIGVFKHGIKKNGEYLLSFVEKLISNSRRGKQELDLYVQIKNLIDKGEAIYPLPQVLAISEYEDHASILMKYYNGVGERLDGSATYGEVLADLVCAINSAPVEIRADNNLRETIEMVLRAVERLDKASDLQSFSAEVIGIYYDNINNMGREVKSHNDLFHSNISVDIIDGTPSATCIDLGLMANNYIGADFHHFARRSVVDSQYYTLFKTCTSLYATQAEDSVSRIQFNAYYYGLLRLIYRSCRMDEGEAKSEIRAGIKMLEACYLIIESRLI